MKPFWTCRLLWFDATVDTLYAISKNIILQSFHFITTYWISSIQETTNIIIKNYTCDNYCNWSAWIENTIIREWKDSNFNNFLSKCQSLQDVLKLMKHSFVCLMWIKWFFLVLDSCNWGELCTSLPSEQFVWKSSLYNLTNKSVKILDAWIFFSNTLLWYISRFISHNAMITL